MLTSDSRQLSFLGKPSKTKRAEGRLQSLLTGAFSALHALLTRMGANKRLHAVLKLQDFKTVLSPPSILKTCRRDCTLSSCPAP